MADSMPTATLSAVVIPNWEGSIPVMLEVGMGLDMVIGRDRDRDREKDKEKVNGSEIKKKKKAEFVFPKNSS